VATVLDETPTDLSTIVAPFARKRAALVLETQYLERFDHHWNLRGIARRLVRRNTVR